MLSAMTLKKGFVNVNTDTPITPLFLAAGPAGWGVFLSSALGAGMCSATGTDNFAPSLGEGLSVLAQPVKTSNTANNKRGRMGESPSKVSTRIRKPPKLRSDKSI